MKRSLLTALIAVSTLAGCKGNEVVLPKVEVKPYEKLSTGTSLATVNGSNIGSKDLDERVNRSTFQNPSEVTIDKKKEFLDDLIGQEALYQEAKAKGYSDNPRVKQMMAQLLLRNALGSADQIQIADADTKHYFDSHRDEFVIPEKVRARRILVQFGADKSASKAKAQEIQKQVNETPADFGKIAADKSEGPEKARQGELGYFASTGRSGLDEKIVTEAFKLKDNGISGVFETAEGWNIVKVENRAARTERTYDQVKKSIERKLMGDRRKAMQDNFIADLKNKAKIAVNDQALAAYTPTLQPKPAFNGGGMMPGMMQQMQQQMGAGGPQGGPSMIHPAQH